MLRDRRQAMTERFNHTGDYFPQLQKLMNNRRKYFPPPRHGEHQFLDFRLLTSAFLA
jgi:hypothetical protein